MKPITVAVAISGGIDSLVAAHLLQQAGHRVLGIHFLTGYEESGRRPVVDRHRARAKIQPIADRLQIDINILDVSGAFESDVVAYFSRAYRNGQTPNPCLRCNPRIKFGAVLDAARQLGAQCLATGHYARVAAAGGGRFDLKKGVDSAKDQSYFLAFLTQRHLAHALFPLGDLTKAAVRRLAAENSLIPAEREESQDICFVRRGTYGEFLARQPGFQVRPGPIEDTFGKVIGTHKGLHLFTVGQRRGINCPAPEAYYVVRLDPEGNRLVVGTQQALTHPGCRVRDINWIGTAATNPFKASVRLRYRHAPIACEVTPEPGGKARLRFSCPQTAVTPGQGAVFYDGDQVLGGGWICLT